MLVGQTIGTGSYRFEIVDELGSGAMGTVYRAKFHKDGKVGPVALKIVSLGLFGNEGAMARFEREANILKQLRHPHIVKLYATGTYRKTPFIAMEFIDGEALDRVLSRRGRLGWEEVVTYGKQLCEALQYAHEKGIIHRDLKPSNLMITSEGILKLTDFGIAKDTDVTALTGQNSTIGTAAYMSPEQCKGDRNLSNKSDLYSLGIVFFELLTGRKPYTAETTVDMFLKHVNEPTPRIGKQVQELPPKLEALILQLMEKEKEDRPTDAAWVLRMLGEVQEDAYSRVSAGLIAATSKKQDRPRNFDGSKLDETDREAARALRGKKKKKKKEVNLPLLERTWVKALGLLLALAVLAAGAYLALRPASPESLIATIESASSPEARLEAARKYLEEYGDRPGEMTDKAAVAFREGKVRERERQLANRFANAKFSKPEETDDPAAYHAAWQAMEHEKDGNLALAEESVGVLRARFPDEVKLPFALKDEVLAKARWGWVAEKRIVDIDSAGKKLFAKNSMIDDYRLHDLEFKVDGDSPDGLAIRALRLEKIGDKEKARRVWNQLADLTEKDLDKYDWFLLASQQRAKTKAGKLPDDPTASRITLVQAHLDVADKKVRSIVSGAPDENKKRIEARVMCRDLIDLYGEESNAAIKASVTKAETLFKTLSNR